MVAQNAKKGNDRSLGSLEWLSPELFSHVEALQQCVCQAAQDGTAAHVFERGLFALGKTLAQAFLKAVGPGDLGLAHH